jgi:hypothetical protein
LNVATKKDFFPLPFTYEVLNIVVGYEAYSFHKKKSWVVPLPKSIITTTHLGFFNQLIKWLLFFLLQLQLQVHVNDYIVVNDIVMPHGIMVLRL